MNSSEIADTVFAWLLNQQVKPSLSELEHRIRELAEKMPTYVYANGRRKLLDKINKYPHQFLFEEQEHVQGR